MPTAAQFAANRANSQKSSGPRTGAGKARSSQNSRSHGLSGRHLVILPGEEKEFDSLNNSLYDEILPAGPLENEVFRHLIHAAWNQRRCQGADADLLDEVYAENHDPLTYPKLHRELRLINLYSQRAASAFNTAMKNLRHLQTQRHLRKAMAAPSPAALDPAAPRLADLTVIHSAILKNRTQSTRLLSAQVLLERRQISLDKAIRDLPEAA